MMMMMISGPEISDSTFLSVFHPPRQNFVLQKPICVSRSCSPPTSAMAAPCFELNPTFSPLFSQTSHRQVLQSVFHVHHTVQRHGRRRTSLLVGHTSLTYKFCPFIRTVVHLLVSGYSAQKPVLKRAACSKAARRNDESFTFLY